MDIDRFLVEVNGAGVREALRLILDLELSGSLPTETSGTTRMSIRCSSG